MLYPRAQVPNAAPRCGCLPLNKLFQGPMGLEARINKASLQQLRDNDNGKWIAFFLTSSLAEEYLLLRLSSFTRYVLALC
jgi:hypothetical protein